MIRIAIIGNYAMQFLHKSLSKISQNLKADYYLADYKTTDMEIIDADSGLYKFQPDFIIWHESALGVREMFYEVKEEDRFFFADSYVTKIENYIDIVSCNLPNVKIIFPNFSLQFMDNVYGSFGFRVKNSWVYQIFLINIKIFDLQNKKDNFYLLESRSSTEDFPVTNYALVINADLHFSLEYLDWLSNQIIRIIKAYKGIIYKCVILDLDNTLWGGIIGDDGIENIQIGNIGIGKAYSKLQRWLKELKNRGIILAVCSKNEESIAKIPFENHSEMILDLNDIAVFIANWDSKADNISVIREILNIGYDSMIFIDDNPAEREIVRKFIPEILVPELPRDPANYLPYLIELNLFDAISFSSNDSIRTLQYQQEAKRVALQKSITNMDVYLQSLEMVGKITPIQNIDIERVAQLTQRSNQFNLRTKRYTGEDIKKIIQNPDFITIAFELSDKFGNYGLVSVVIVDLQKEVPFIDTWIMSCRVLKRNVEQALMNYLIEILNNSNYNLLLAEYIPTEKNKLVKDLLINFGMLQVENNRYKLSIDAYCPNKHYIKLI